MAAMDKPLVAREALHQLAKRSSWPSRNAGVMVVFCIVFVVAVGLVALWIYKFMQKRKEKKPNF